MLKSEFYGTNVKDLEVEVKELKEDILTLLKEVEELEEEKKKLEQDYEEIDQGECEKPEEKKTEGVCEDFYINEIFSECFKEEKSVPEKNENVNEFSFNVKTKMQIMEENIFRFCGITPFQLNSGMTESECLMGLRFDVYSGLEHKFLMPHYVILRRMEQRQKKTLLKRRWEIYKYTLPDYVPLETFFNEYFLEKQDQENLVEFSEKIWEFLTRNQYKKDKIEQLKCFVYGFFESNTSDYESIICRIDSDLQNEEVVLSIYDRKTGEKRIHEIKLTCSEDRIEKVNISVAQNKSKNENLICVCESVLSSTKFQDLKKNMRKVFEILIKNQII